MFNEVLFLLSGLLTVFGALAVVFTKNLMHACVYLLASLFGVAGLYLTLGADFLAAAQIVVYAGGVVVLMLFAVMLTGGTVKDAGRYAMLKVPSMGNAKTFSIAALGVLVALSMTTKIILGIGRSYDASKELPAFTSTVESIGTLLVTDHVLAFEISSVLLLGALVGAVVISRPRKS